MLLSERAGYVFIEVAIAESGIYEKEKVEMYMGTGGDAGNRKSAAQCVCMVPKRVYCAHRTGKRKFMGTYEDYFLSAASCRVSVQSEERSGSRCSVGAGGGRSKWFDVGDGVCVSPDI